MKTKLKQVIWEMEDNFNKWDSRQESNLQPVAIQDLEFWIVTLKEVSKRMDELIERTLSLDKRLLQGKTPEVELGEITRLRGAEKKGFICCLCGKHTIGWDEKGIYGNNPAPLKDKGECCDECNETKVIPARLGEFLK
jgi:hypothetical protein